jgi:hypothetical protein
LIISKVLRLFRYILYYPLVIFTFLEVILRFLGFRPYEHTDFKVVSQPPHAYTGHTSLGIQLNEGAFDITINDHLTFHAIHQSGGYRKTNEDKHVSQLDVLMLGCSYTYGYGVNDEENFTALLQRRYPNIHIRNAGVVGHGTVQALLLLQEVLKNENPKLVLLNFSSYHLMRNTLSQAYRSHLSIGYNRASPSAQYQMSAANFPFLTSCEDSIQQVSWDRIYSHWPGRESLALVHALQKTYDHLIDDIDNQISVTACLIREIAQLCDEKGISFHIVNLNPSSTTQKLRQQVRELSWLDIGYHFTDTTMTNYPYDDHPNQKGHEFIANQIDWHLAHVFHQLEKSR